MKKPIIRALCLGLCTAGMTLPASAEDVTVNRLLASQCAQCHGTNGHAVGNMDSLHDESAQEIREELTEMQREGRPGDIMEHQALGYTADQIRRIAQYFGSRTGSGGQDPGTGGGNPEPDHESEHNSDENASDNSREKTAKAREARKSEREKRQERQKRREKNERNDD